ncbi:MAG: Holliday junction resolvase RuvX [Alphaproteobacteria bacterium]|nr:Holliday junction resolvase RuvX [Alphaproteobacteria bacterium]
MAYTDSLNDFAGTLSAGRLLGLDLGSKTLGLALSDTDATIATPFETYPRGKFGHDADALCDLIDLHEIKGLVCGLPLNMDASSGTRVQATRAYVRNLSHHNRFALPILLWDERLSSVAVERTLLEADVSRRRRAQVIDKMAAAFILQGALDALNK